MLAGGAFSGAAQAQESPAVVEIKGMKDPQMRSYRAVAAGLDAFDKHHALAPKVGQLWFRIAPAPANKGASIEGITMRIVGEGEAIPVPIGADGLFVVPRNQAAHEDDADLVMNRKTGLFRTQVQVRTPGLKSNLRRLGDLRLECQATIAIVKKEAPFYIVALGNTVFLSTDWCNKEGLNWGIGTAARLDKATLVHGERRTALKAGE